MNFSTDIRDYLGTPSVYVFALAGCACGLGRREVDDFPVDLLGLIPVNADGLPGLSPLPDHPIMREMAREAVADMLRSIKGNMELIPELESYLAAPTDAPALFNAFPEEDARIEAAGF